MDESGVQDFSSASHAEYFSKIRDSITSCETHPMSEIDKLKAGDLLCRCRGNGCTQDYNINSGAAHCDVVVELTRNSAGEIISRKMIGGNRATSDEDFCGVDSNGDPEGCTVYQSSHTSLNPSSYFGFISC